MIEDRRLAEQERRRNELRNEEVRSQGQRNEEIRRKEQQREEPVIKIRRTVNEQVEEGITNFLYSGWLHRTSLAENVKQLQEFV